MIAGVVGYDNIRKHLGETRGIKHADIILNLGV